MLSWLQTLVDERDVRQLIAIRDLSQFQRFVKMCAARSGQLLNLTALGADCGLSATTAREWLSVLEASYLVMRLQPNNGNFGKRLVKTTCIFGGIAQATRWTSYLIETPNGLQAIEIKSGSTFAPDWIKGLNKWQSIAGVSKRQPQIIYGGATGYERESCQVVGWQMGGI